MPVKRESAKVIHAYSSNKGGVANPSLSSIHLKLMSCLTKGGGGDAAHNGWTRYEDTHTVGCMPMSLFHAARVIPFAWRDDIKAQIATMVRQSAIEPLGDLPRAWCHPLVIVPKPIGGLDICIDLTKLNRYVYRAYYPLKSQKEVISEVTSGQITSQL